MASLFDIIRNGLEQASEFPPETAERIAVELMEWGAEQGHATERHYWPAKVRGMSADERNAAVRREFDGTNLTMICEKYQVSKSTVYDIVRAK